jgi:uncharacterized YccA/Bax inhibitor family protein
MPTANPALTTNTFSDLEKVSYDAETMTIQGTINKTALMLLCVLISATLTWRLYFTGSTHLIPTLSIVGVIGGLITAMLTIYKKNWAPITAPIYALLEGLFIGALSAILEVSYPGIAIQAAMLTFGTLGALLLAYTSGLIQATEKFKLGVVAATGGIAIVYFVSIILSFFGIQIPFIYGSGMVSILFSLFVVVIAALNLVIDFDFIEQGARRRAPKYMEWYGAFALMVTLIWLYIEVLRLLSKMRERK